MKKRRIRYAFSAFICVLIFNGCSKEKTFDCIKSTGDIKKENRYFDNFSSLSVEDNINVVLVQSLPGLIILEAGDNLLPKLKCEQEGKKLTIRNKNTCNWVRSYDKPINLYVGVDQVKEISQTGYGTIRNGEALKTDTLRIYNLTFGETDLTIEAKFIGFQADDHGSFTIKGKANSMAGGCYRNGLVNTEAMEVPWLVFKNTSLVTARVYSDSLIQAEIAGDGDIICNGKPTLVEYKYTSGKGTLRLP